MNDNEIIDLILGDLKQESPRNLITDILSPRQLWNEKEEQRISNIIILLKDKHLIQVNGGDKYFPGTDMSIGIKGDAIELLNEYGSYSSYLQLRNKNKSERIEIKVDNVHVGNNFGNYSQAATHSAVKSGDKKDSIAKQIIIGIIVTVVGGLLVWYLTTQK